MPLPKLRELSSLELHKLLYDRVEEIVAVLCEVGRQEREEEKKSLIYPCQHNALWEACKEVQKELYTHPTLRIKVREEILAYLSR